MTWRRVDWSSAVQFRRVGSAEVSYVDLGTRHGGAPPLVLIHGLGGQWQNWLENLVPLSRERRVVALDLPGFGRSQPLAQPTEFDGYADAVAGLCETLDIDRFVAVGSSFGGLVATDLAVRYAERVDRLALVDAAGIGLTFRERLFAVAALRTISRFAGPAQRAYRIVASRPTMRRLALKLALEDGAAVPADTVYHALLGPPAPSFAAVLGAAVGWVGERWEPNLRRVACPTLVVWGERDRLLPLRHGQRLAELIPASRLVVIPGAGHASMLERPQEFNRLLLRFAA